MKNLRGFTLLEVLIALGIVSVISILSWRGLEEVLRSAKRIIEVDDQVQTVSAVFSQIEKDLASLELSTEPPTLVGDLVEVSKNGLLIQYTQRKTSEPAYQERVEWVLDGTNLLRVARRELGPDKPSISEPIPTLGLQLRLFREPGGWSNPTAFGNVAVQERSDLELQGAPLQLNIGAPTEQAAQGLVRAVEVSLTQANNQTVSRIFLTGGVY
jgi:prepilin-type N-terminal cleavage/methylation domain-containing protein